MNLASNMSSKTAGTAALLCQNSPMALYFNSMMHCFNLCTSQSVNVASIRNCIDVVREVIGFFRFSAHRYHILQEKYQKEYWDSVRLKKLCDTCLNVNIPVYWSFLSYCHLSEPHLSISKHLMSRQSSASRTFSVISGEIWISHKSSRISRDHCLTHRHLQKFANCGLWHH